MTKKITNSEKVKVVEVQTTITHDLVLDCYEKYLAEKDPKKKKKLLENVDQLQENLGNLLVLDDDDLKKEVQKQLNTSKRSK